MDLHRLQRPALSRRCRPRRAWRCCSPSTRRSASSRCHPDRCSPTCRSRSTASRASRAPTSPTSAAGRRVGYVFYIEPGPAPGTNIAYLGPGDQGRRAAAGAQRRHGRAHQRRVAELHASTTTKGVLPIVFIQNQLTKAPIPIPIPDINPLNRRSARSRRRSPKLEAAEGHRQAERRCRRSCAASPTRRSSRRRGDRQRQRSTCCATAAC